MTKEIVLRIQMPVKGHHIDIYTGAVLRFVSFKPDETLSIWYTCTLDAFNSPKREIWGFVVVATGEPIETDHSYLGSGVNSNGLVFHVYGGKL